MDRRSRPYFCGIDRSLNFQQKEALAQGILQVIETIPAGFESFEFQFTQQKVHIYKLDRGIILLVLTQENLVPSDYQKAIQNLTRALDGEVVGTIATLRQTTGSTFSSWPYRKPPSASEASPVLSPLSPPTLPDFATLTDLLAALNHLSHFTSQYLGTHVIVNYWKITRPTGEWLDQFQVDRSARFSLPSEPEPNLLHVLTPQEQSWAQSWVAAFMQRCALVIRDFPAIVEQKALTPPQKSLLLGKP